MHRPHKFRAVRKSLVNASAFLLTFLFVFSPVFQAFAEELVVDVSSSASLADENLSFESKTITEFSSENINESDSKLSTNLDLDLNSDLSDDDPPPPPASPYFDPTTSELANQKNLSKSQVNIEQFSGALAYSYPIEAPAGRNNLTPEVRIKYNSQDLKNTALGYGWDLNIPYIERLNKNGLDKLYTDNFFTSSEQGELANISGGLYRPKTTGTDFSSFDFNSESWVVTAKDGTKYFYGSTSDSRIINPADSSKIFKWMLDEIRDSNGNSIIYSYSKISGQVYIDSISYSKKGSETAPYNIRFSYIDSLPTYSYSAGFMVPLEKRLSSISVYFNGDWIKRYDIGYIQDELNQRSRLSSITANAKNSLGFDVSYPPETFEYQKNLEDNTNALVSDPQTNRFTASTFAAVFGDVNGDGLVDMVRSNCTSCGSLNPNKEHVVYINDGDNLNASSWVLPQGVYFYGDEKDHGWRFVDINGDFKSDIVQKIDSYSPVVYINNGANGWSLSSLWTIPHKIINSNNSVPTGQRFLDYNQDGYMDSIIFYGAGNYPSVEGEYSKNNGDGTWTSYIYYPYPVNTFTAIDGKFGTYIADVNSDGLPDQLKTSQENTLIKTLEVNTGDNKGFAVSNSVDLQNAGLFNPGFSSASSDIWYLGDVNNDGLDDAFLPNNGSGAQTAILGINKFTNASARWNMFFHPFAPGYPSGRQFIDINGDGSLDSILAYNNGSSIINSSFINQSKNPELLVKINYREGGSASVEYGRTNKSVSGILNNSKLPYSINIVKKISTNDGFGNIKDDAYSYEGGEIWNITNPHDRKFAGFSSITTTSSNSVTKEYYHQGNSSNSTLGEYGDSASKIGKPYRKEIYDLSNNLKRIEITKWDSASVGSGSDFIFPARITTQDYGVGESRKDISTEYSYDNSNGSLLVKTEWGEVVSGNDGAFTDSLSDKRVSTYEYASNSTNGVVVPIHITVTDASSAKVSEEKYYYDELPYGSVSKGNPTKVEKWKSGSSYVNTEKAYNSFGNVTTSKDERGKTTSYIYDTYNLYPKTITNPLSQAENYTYDYSNGKVLTKTDSNSGLWSFSYDGFGRVLEERVPNKINNALTDLKTSYAYTDTSNAVSVKKTDYLDALNGVDTYSYMDGLGRVIQTRKESETGFDVTDYEYNEKGLAKRKSLPYAGVGFLRTAPTATASLYENYSYDTLDRITSAQNSVGTTSYAYDGWKTSVTDPRGKTKHYYKDAYGNLARVDEINSGSTYMTGYNWNLNGNLTKITDALGNIRNFAYDGLGRRTSAEDLHVVDDPTFGVWSYVYDNAGNITQTTNPDGKIIDYTYDDLNRVKTENFAGGAGVEISYTYDTCTKGIGKLCSVVMLSGANSSYAYDSLGNIVSEDRLIKGKNYNTKYSYGIQGNLASVTYPDGDTVNYSYNNAGLLDRVEKVGASNPASLAVVSNINYSPMGQKSAIIYGNGVTTNNTYDPASLYRLSRKTTANISGTKLQDIGYTYDANGNITQIADTSNTNASKTVAYVYDDLNRLTSATASSVASGQVPYIQTFSYNAIGNITSKSDAGAYAYAGNTGTSYANPHAATSIGANTVTYDKTGNMLATTNGLLGNIISGVWNYKGELVSTTKNGLIIDYLYDHAGNRVALLNGVNSAIYPNKYYSDNENKKTKQIYADDELVATLETTNAEMVITVDSIGKDIRLVGEIISSGPTKIGFTNPITNIYYVHTDHLKGSNVMTNATGNVVQLLDYYPYGEARINEKSGAFNESKQFTGYIYDTETGLNYANARYYNSKEGRFISQDRMFWALPQELLIDPQQQNSYSYARNNPIVNTDPSGEISMSGIVKGISNVLFGKAQMVYAPGYHESFTQSFTDANYKINFAPNVDQSTVSIHSKHVIQDSMISSGEKSVLITSTIRTPEKQAKIMHDNALKYGVQEQYNLYSSYGDSVIDKFPDLSSMTKTIYELGPTNISNHIRNPKNINVIDIAPSSVKNKDIFKRSIQNNPGIYKMILPPKDPAFHLEIKQPK